MMWYRSKTRHSTSLFEVKCGIVYPIAVAYNGIQLHRTLVDSKFRICVKFYHKSKPLIGHSGVFGEVYYVAFP